MQNGSIIPVDKTPQALAIWNDWCTTKLRIFQPLELTAAQKRAVEAERTYLQQKQLHHPLFLAEAPIPVAVLKPFTQWSQNLWVPRLRKPIFIRDESSENKPLLLKKNFQDFRMDSEIIIKNLFGSPPLDTTCRIQAGIYKNARFSHLHHDPYNYFLLIRSLALPFEFVRKENEQLHPKLIAAAKIADASGEAARRQLRALAILQAAHVDTLYLMPSEEPNGILHCSGPVPGNPVRGTPSMLSRCGFNYHARTP